MASTDESAAGDMGSSNHPDENPSLAMALTDLIPLLLRLQSQLGGPQAHAIGLGEAAPDPMLDHQAAIRLTEDICSDRVRSLNRYLQRHANNFAGLQACKSLVANANRSLSAKDYNQAFALIWQTYRMITTLRAQNPDLPPANESGEDGAGAKMH